MPKPPKAYFPPYFLL